MHRLPSWISVLTFRSVSQCAVEGQKGTDLTSHLCVLCPSLPVFTSETLNQRMMYTARCYTSRLNHRPVGHQEHYQLYQGRHDAHRGHPHYHQQQFYYHQYYHTQHHYHGKKKTWNFIHEKMSYDTFFTMKRLIDRSRTVDEVLRWVTQNPGKISYNHYPIALQKIGQILQQGGTGSCLNGDSHYSQVSEQLDFQTLCNSIIKDCSKFDHFSIVNCLYAVAALGRNLILTSNFPRLYWLQLCH